MLISLINEIAAIPGRIILVLDDHHTVESLPVDDALAFLLDRLPPQMYLVIASREDPPLPLARLRARGQLTELRATDLRFTTSEAAEFLNHAMGLDLSAEDIAALYNTAFGLEGPDAVTPNKALRFTLHPGLHPTGAFLILDGPVPVGLGVGRVEMPAAGASARLGAVELLAVRPEYRRRGVASALLHAILGWLAGQGVTHVHASVEDTPALLLLQRYGFSPVSP